MNLQSLYESSIGRSATLRRLCQVVAAPLVQLLCRVRGWRFTPDIPLWSRLSWALDLYSREDRQTFRDYRRLLRPGDTVLDVGANLGTHARQFSKLVGPAGRVYSFEPTPAVFECLQFNTRHLTNCTCVRKAVYRDDTTLSFQLNAVSSLGNSLAPEGADAYQTIQVEAIALDSWVPQQSIPRLRLLKIDVEGAECNVLRGAAQVISDHPDLVLLLEYCPGNMQRFGITPEEFHSATQACGLQLFEQEPAGTFRELETVAELEQARGDWEYINVVAARAATTLS